MCPESWISLSDTKRIVLLLLLKSSKNGCFRPLLGQLFGSLFLFQMEGRATCWIKTRTKRHLQHGFLDSETCLFHSICFDGGESAHYPLVREQSRKGTFVSTTIATGFSHWKKQPRAKDKEILSHYYL